MIGDEIEVSVLSIMGEKVRIGIQAPRDIPVFRKEVYLEIQQENVAAGRPPRRGRRRPASASVPTDAVPAVPAAGAPVVHEVASTPAPVEGDARTEVDDALRRLAGQ